MTAAKYKPVLLIIHMDGDFEDDLTLEYRHGTFQDGIAKLEYVVDEVHEIGFPIVFANGEKISGVAENLRKRISSINYKSLQVGGFDKMMARRILIDSINSLSATDAAIAGWNVTDCILKASRYLNRNGIKVHTTDEILFSYLSSRKEEDKALEKIRKFGNVYPTVDAMLREVFRKSFTTLQ